ncbi:MAG TPA: TrbI/VirB10 family protein [Acidobacteriota bacterium]|nr:TrbI/VirB10 family protein [Acidobacteriota bacterium]
MDSQEKGVRTDIANEEGLSTAKGRKRVWLYVGLGATLLAVATAILFMIVRRNEVTPQTGADQEQQKYDAGQKEQDRQKAARLHDDTFIVRKEDDNQAQLNSLLKDLGMGKSPAAELPSPSVDHQAKADEEAIDFVLRNQASKPSPSSHSYESRPKPAQPETASADTDTRPMFVYSRTFGGAKYVDAQQKQTVQASNEPSSVSAPAQIASSELPKPAQSGAPATEQKTTLIYSNYPPVTMYEGEMLEAVLVNRIIADTEPSPVVCNLAKDLFDHNAEYVVLPANSRVLGLSQVVNYKGAHRLFISFNRIILPNGPSIDLPPSRKALKALDETGALGVVSKVERHWFLQFGTAIFFGALDGLAGAAQRNRDVFSTNAVILGRTSENFERILENIMSQYSTIVPTIRVDQGKKLLIYLSDDVLITPYAKISDRSYYAKR